MHCRRKKYGLFSEIPDVEFDSMHVGNKLTQCISYFMYLIVSYRIQYLLWGSNASDAVFRRTRFTLYD